MATNIKWIQQEWDRFLIDPRGKKIPLPTVEGEHLAKLFAAYVIERLEIEHKVEEEITGS